jgi:hypothetical protein
MTMSVALKRVTLAAVNAAVRAAGGAEELRRGNGYFYFAGGDASRWPATAVYTAHLGSTTVEQWVAEWRHLRAAAR